MHLLANPRNTLWFKFKPGQRRTSFRAGNQPSGGMPSGDAGSKTRNVGRLWSSDLNAQAERGCLLGAENCFQTS